MFVYIFKVSSIAAVLSGICFISTTCNQYSPCHPYACEFGECISKEDSFLCICGENHVGPTCNVRRSPLINCNINGPYSCFNGGICNTTANSYTCICPPNFAGFFCEEHIEECSTSPCVNGGTCINRIGSYYCICPHGFKGVTCMESIEMCSAVTCLNGGICIDGTDGYVCECPRGYFGTRCQYTEHGVSRRPNKKTANRLTEDCDECSYGSSGNNDLDVDNFVFSTRKPFTSCPNSTYCSKVFKNSICNKECNVETCLFDGFDCISKISKCPSHISTHCNEGRGNSICDEPCNHVACNYSVDCKPSFSNILRGEIFLVVLTRPVHFISSIPSFLNLLSQLLRADVRIKSDEVGFLVFSWEHGNVGERIRILNKSSPRYPINPYNSTDRQGVLASIEVDVSRCVNECFSDIEVVANFIEAAKEQFIEMDMPIHSAVAKIREKKKFWTLSLIVVVTCSSVIIVFMVLLTVYERSNRKRKIIENAPVWVPPTEFESEKHQKQSKEENEQYISLCDSRKLQDNDSSRLRLFSQSVARKIPRIFVLPKSTMSQPTPSRLYIESASAHPISFPFTAKEANQRGPYGRTPLMMLAKNTVKTEEQLINDVTKLCDIGADINLLDDYDDTALHMTVSSGRIALVRKLLHFGASPVIRDGTNSTCLHLAARACASDMIAALLEVDEMRNEVNAVDNSNRTALMLVAMHDRVDTKAAKMLIEAGAKVDYDGDNTLTSWRGRTALHFAAKYDNAQMVAFLLQMMANENCQDYEYCTPLHLAAAEGHIGPVKELLKGGANVLLRNDRYQTPYDIALLNNCHSVAALLASSDNLRVQLYSNHGEMLASSSPPCFKHVKILSSNIKPPRAQVTYESKGCTQSTTAADESASVFSPYNYIITPYSAAVCGTTTPSELSSVKSAQMVSSGCTTHFVHYITPYVQRFDDSRIDPGSILSSPHYEEVEKCCMKSEKQMGKSSGFFDSGFGILSDISKRDSIAPCHTFDRFLIPKDCVDACSKPFVSSQEFIV